MRLLNMGSSLAKANAENKLRNVVGEALREAVSNHAEDWAEVADTVIQRLRIEGYKIKKIKDKEGKEADARQNELLASFSSLSKEIRGTKQHRLELRQLVDEPKLLKRVKQTEKVI